MIQAILAFLLDVPRIFTKSCWRKHQGTTVLVPHWPFNLLNDQHGSCRLQIAGRVIAWVPYFVPILWPVPNIKYILFILPCSQETNHENNHVVQLKLKGKRHCSTVMNWSTKSGATLLGNHHPDLHRLVYSTTWKVLTGRSHNFETTATM